MAQLLPTPLARVPSGSPDESLLCGRTAEVQKLVENCEAGRLTVVSSAPGLGLSCLLRSGVAPALKRAGYVTILFSDWQGRAFAARLREAVLKAIHEEVDGGFVAGAEPLNELISKAQRQTGCRIAILLDQFEDYLRCHVSTDISDSFDAELSNAIGGRVASFVVAMQEAAVESFLRLSQYVPNLMGYSLTLAGLTPDAAGQLVRNLAARSKMQVEPAAVEQLIAAPAAAAGSGVNPLFLTLGVENLIDKERRLKSTTLHASIVEANGGADRLILDSMDLLLDAINSTHAELLFRWVTLLRGEDGSRLPVSEQALIEHSGKWDRFAMTLIALLTKEGVLRTIELPLGIRYEFARVSMTAIVQDWWQRRETALIARQRAAFRVRSISIAVGSILAAYGVYLFLVAKKII